MKKFALAALLVGFGLVSFGCGEKVDPKAGTYNPAAADPTQAKLPPIGGAPAGGAAPAEGGAAAPAGS